MWGRAAGGSRNKFANKKTVVDGMVFDSKKEAERWRQLALMEAAGEINDLQTQVRFPFVVNGQRVCSYVADFMYYDTRTLKRVVEDVKSPPTRKNPTYRLKFKLFRALYGFEITET